MMEETPSAEQELIQIYRLFLRNEVTLHEAIACWMHSGLPAPGWLIEAYERALMEYQSGADFLDLMGLTYAKGHGTARKRADFDQEQQIVANLRYVMEDLVEIGLPKVKTTKRKKLNADQSMKVRAFLKLYRVTLSPKIESELDWMTAYEVAGLIFRKSESKIRQLCSLL